jgi:outer membrane murein-binding lipoprotein Lpp
MAWVDKATAASLLGISARTMERRVAAGKVQTRKDEGRVLVLVEDPPAPAGVEIVPPGSSGDMTQAVRADPPAERRACESCRDTLAASQRMAEQAEIQVRRARLDAHVAAAVIFVLLVLGGAGLWYSSRQMATARTTVERLSARVTELSEGRQQAIDELKTVREELARTQSGDGAIATRR